MLSVFSGCHFASAILYVIPKIISPSFINLSASGIERLQSIRGVWNSAIVIASKHNYYLRCNNQQLRLLAGVTMTLGT